jgi:uncharacterized glyoxalase superfamily protein PhnB
MSHSGDARQSATSASRASDRDEFGSRRESHPSWSTRSASPPPTDNECVLSVYASDEDAVRARHQGAVGAGGTSVYEPSQREWGAFAAQVADPDGHLWMILLAPPDWSA